MAVKITGYYKLPNEIEPQLIEFDKVFNISFMRKYTNYKTFAKFLTGVDLTSLAKKILKNYQKI